MAALHGVTCHVLAGIQLLAYCLGYQLARWSHYPKGIGGVEKDAYSSCQVR